MESGPGRANQAALVCGGTGRVGSSIAAALGASGIPTAVHYRQNRERALQLVNQIQASGGHAVALQADLTDEASVAHLVDDVHRQLGGIHILVNTVHGQFDPKDIVDMGWGDWTVHLDALKSHFLVCRAVVPVMRAQGYGRLIYISGGLAKRYFKGCSAYTTVKAGLNGFCKTLALEEGPHGITVNIVAPGKVVPFDGRDSTDNPDAWEEMNQQSLAAIPLGRYASTNDVSNAVLYLASQEAGGITGQTLFVAGGEIMP